MAEMEEVSRQCGKFCEEELGAVALVLHLSGSVFLWSGPGRRTAASQGRSCGCFVGILSTRGECSSKDVRQNHSRPSRPSCRGSKWCCLLLRIVLHDALSEVTKIYSTLKPCVFLWMNDITALVKGKNKEVAEMAKKVMKKLKEEVEKNGLKLSVTENGRKERAR